MPLLPLAAALMSVTLLCAVAPASASTAEGAVQLLEERFAELDAACNALKEERRELVRQGAELAERLRTCQGGSEMLNQLTEQSALLTRLAERLDSHIGGIESMLARGVNSNGEKGTGQHPLADENARLQVRLEEAERRLSLLMSQFVEAHKLRLQQAADAAAARDEAAKLHARLQQQAQKVQEAQLRADKAEKLYAALEEAHARVTTENERLTLELSAARERQAESMQRVVELNERVAAAEARAAGSGQTPEAASPGMPATVPANNGDPAVSGTAVYRVRAQDTLSSIAGKVYGDPGLWERLLDANRDLLDSPADLAPGMMLIVP
ncbi:MAG: LysM peptidoglycan-binding domain-containing protein [Thiohalocapsa sp.]|nr:LysM peptidoglycan-binding domain-containing protein [Thiohalocapsa sp.]